MDSADANSVDLSSDTNSSADDWDMLNEEQHHKILQFQDLTGCENSIECRQLLTCADWNLNTAIEQYYEPNRDEWLRDQRAVNDFTDSDNGASDSEPHVPASSSSSAFPANMFSPRRRAHSLLSQSDSAVDSTARTTTTTAENPHTSALYTVPTSIVRYVGHALYYLFSDWIWSPFYITLSLATRAFRFMFGFMLDGVRTDPKQEVMCFINSFERQYSTGLDFYPGTYSEALSEARRSLRFLLVYLHSSRLDSVGADESSSVQEFCRNTLAALAEFCQRRNLLVWACSTDTQEGWRVSRALFTRSYPFFAIICLQNNRMTLAGKAEGVFNFDQIKRRLEQIIDDNMCHITAALQERQERLETQQIREQQDAAYIMSLRADEEKERKKQELIEKRLEEENSKRQLELERQSKLEEIANLRIQLASEIPEDLPPDALNSVRICIKMPTGTRIEKRFDHKHSIKVLYYVVFCHPECPLNFEITQNCPRRVLPCSPELNPPSFLESGLSKSELLYVRDLDA